MRLVCRHRLELQFVEHAIPGRRKLFAVSIKKLGSEPQQLLVDAALLAAGTHHPLVIDKLLGNACDLCEIKIIEASIGVDAWDGEG